MKANASQPRWPKKIFAIDMDSQICGEVGIHFIEREKAVLFDVDGRCDGNEGTSANISASVIATRTSSFWLFNRFLTKKKTENSHEKERNECLLGY